jgi:hypothetical protein
MKIVITRDMVNLVNDQLCSEIKVNCPRKVGSVLEKGALITMLNDEFRKSLVLRYSNPKIPV